MAFPKIEIKSVGEKDTLFTEIYIDGHKIPGIRRYELKQVGGEVPVLTIDIAALNIRTDMYCSLRQMGVQGEIKQVIFEHDYL